MKPLRFGEKVRVLWKEEWFDGVVIGLGQDDMGEVVSAYLKSKVHSRSFLHGHGVTVGIGSGEIKRGWKKGKKP